MITKLLLILLLSSPCLAACVKTDTGWIMFDNAPANGKDAQFQLLIECRHGFMSWLKPRYDEPPGLRVYTFYVGMEERKDFTVKNGLVTLSKPPQFGAWVFFAIYEDHLEQKR